MMIQSVMLVVLGFLLASLLALFIAPAFWARAVRLTTGRLRSALPLTEAEINADRDQLRAQYAIKVHQLQKAVDEAKLNTARQLIELNRRDASIGKLEDRVAHLQSDLEENQNARRVLEQTLSDRLPKVEVRLRETRRLLDARDREIVQLGRSAHAQEQALDEAQTIHAQQQAEIEWLKAALTAHQTRGRRGLHQPNFESEFAMRTEVEALRAKTREQTGLVKRLQGELAGALDQGQDAGRLSVIRLSAGKLSAVRSERGQDRRRSASLDAVLDAALAVGGGGGGGDDYDHLLQQQAAQLPAEDGASDTQTAASSEAELRRLEARNEDQAAEIARLAAELAALEAQQKGGHKNPIRETKARLKAKLDALDVKAGRQMETINRLRSELAAANDRSARQAAYFMDEMRLIGTTGAGRSARHAGAIHAGAIHAGAMSAGTGVAAEAVSSRGAGGHASSVAKRARKAGKRHGKRPVTIPTGEGTSSPTTRSARTAGSRASNGSDSAPAPAVAAFGRRLLGTEPFGEPAPANATGANAKGANAKGAAGENTANLPDVTPAPVEVQPESPASDDGGDRKKPLLDRLKRLQST